MPIDEKLKEEILKTISLSGVADYKKASERQIISGNSGEYGDNGNNLIHILNLSSGSARFQTNIAKRFKLIISQPKSLSALSSFQIRCSLCRSVISYPCWYYSIKYAVNHFHYFICFDDKSSDKPSTRCYRRI